MIGLYPVIYNSYHYNTKDGGQSSKYGETNTFDNENLKLSKNSGTIHISGNSGWSDAKAAGICIGQGTETNPYIIEDLVIDAEGSGSGILIDLSTVIFIIRNCTIQNSGSLLDTDAGIRLFSVSNGRLIDNNCSLNEIGIILENSHRNSILRNIMHDNNNSGMFLSDSSYNLVSENIVNNNLNEGIEVHKGNQNNFSNNNVKYNRGSGLYLELCFFSNISRNNISKNDNGLSLINSLYNDIMKNIVINNFLNGIYLEDCDDNKILGNNINYNEIGIYLYQSNDNDIIGNFVDYNNRAKKEDKCKGNYFKGNKGISNSNGRFPFEIVIIIGIIIILIMLLTGMIILRRKSSREVVTFKKDIGKANGYNQKISESLISSKNVLTPHELEEIKPEGGEEKEQHICVVHRGKILGVMYICPVCETYYCMKCAKALKNKGETCWACNSEIKL